MAKLNLVAGASQCQVEYGRQAPMQGGVMEEPSLKVAKWTDWFNLLERRGPWGHWMNSACPDQVRYGFWLNTVPSEK